MWKRWNIIVTTAALLAGVPWVAKAQTPINVSYQPAVYWALPYYLATEKGWWKEVGLAPSFSVFPAARRKSRRPKPVPGMSAAPARSRRFSERHDRACSRSALPMTNPRPMS